MTLKNQFGTSLLEVLVSLLLLSVGFLGLATTQLLSAKNLSSSNERTLATFYIESMADQIRSFQEGINKSSLNDLEKNTEVICSGGCTSTQLLQRSFVSWNQDINRSVVDGGLPGGEGTVSYSESEGIFEIKIIWSDRSQFSNQGDGQKQEVVSRIQI